MAQFRILSIDGGGVKGIVSAYWLAQMQEELPKPLHEYFDIIIGTSTGAILAAAVASGVSADEYVDLYLKKARKIFPGFFPRIWSRFKRIFTQGFSAPKYDGKGLDKTLYSFFGELKMKDLKTTTLFTAYDVSDRSTIVFKTTKGSHEDLHVWSTVRASSAAPTFLPGHVITVGDTRHAYIDGGVVANNPVLCGIAEAIREKGARPDQCVVVSIGTGQPESKISIWQSKTWGAIQWALPIIDVMFDGDRESAQYITQSLIPESQYFRIQTKVKTKMDNASKKNLKKLLDKAERDRKSIVTLFDVIEKLKHT